MTYRGLLLILFLGLIVPCFSQETIQGIVTDKDTNEPLIGANVFIKGTSIGTSADLDGYFRLDFPQGIDSSITLIVSYVGYPSFSLENVQLGQQLNIALESNNITGCGTYIDVYAAYIPKSAPTPYQTLLQKDIKALNIGVDVPILLDQTPSMMVTSDAGNGIGYTSMRLRGTDQTRINVSINGVPLNDAESQQVFWVDLPDLLATADAITVQRGVGVSTQGVGSFGGGVHIHTLQATPNPYGRVEASVGSFNSSKLSAQFGSGYLGKNIYVEGRGSWITSDGYIDRATSDLRSFAAKLGYVNDRTSIQTQVLGGHEITYQSWYGLPWQFQDSLPTYNEAGTERAGEPYDNQVDNYQQYHTQLVLKQVFTNRLNGQFALHYTKGKGYYEEYKANQNTQDYPSIFNTSGQTDLVRERWLDNDYYGGLLTLEAELDRQSFWIGRVGGGWHRYDGDHFGRVNWAQTLNPSTTHDYYNDTSLKDDWSTFFQLRYEKNTSFRLDIDLQYRGIGYHYINPNLSADNEQSDHLNFFNPKVGLTFDRSYYITAGFANQEPNRQDYINAADGQMPDHEQLFDLELGYRHPFINDGNQLNINAYWMQYRDQLILTGQLNDVGAYIRTNVPHSYRVGLEIDGKHHFWNRRFTLAGNATFSVNKIKSVTEYIDDYDMGTQIEVQYECTDLPFSPAFIGFLDLQYHPVWAGKNPLDLSLKTKIVSNQYMDFTSSTWTQIPSFALLNLHAQYKLNFKKSSVTLKGQLNNLFNTSYFTNGWTYRYKYNGSSLNDSPYNRHVENGSIVTQNGIYPQAGTNFWLGLVLDI